MRVSGLKGIAYVSVGEDCYIGPNITITPFGGEYFETNPIDAKLLIIGNRVTISPNVTLLCSMHPEKSKLSEIYGKIDKIAIDDDVWVGAGAIILGGVRLHQCSVVGAGAVVTRDVPPNTVVAGVPARPIKTLSGFE
jgi:acetyltransferase-like isoleucine patch superfamily enzyme